MSDRWWRMRRGGATAGPLRTPHADGTSAGPTAPARTLPWTWIALLAGLTASHLVFLVWRVGLPLEVDRNEPWNAWHTMHAFDPAGLYPKSTDLIINNYPPLSFIVLKLLSLGHDAILVGRIVSLVSVGVIAASVASVAKTFGASRGVAAIAGLWCLALFTIVVPKYMGMNDPNFLALAVMTVGLASFVRGSLQGRVPYLACAVMATALFFKHSIVALPIAALAWQYLERRDLFWRSLVCFAAIGFVGLLACRVVYGREFFEQLLLPRQVRLSSGFRFFRVVPPLLPALLVWWRWTQSSAPSASITFTKLAFAVSVPLNFMQQCGAGVDYNATFEFIVVAAMALGCSLDKEGSTDQAEATTPRPGTPRILALLVVLLALFGNRIEPYQFATSKEYRAGVHHQVDILDAEVARIRALPGRVSCSVLVVCYHAGKAFEFDDFGMHQRVATGVWSAERLEQEKSSRRLRFEAVSRAVEWHSTNFEDAFTTKAARLR